MADSRPPFDEDDRSQSLGLSTLSLQRPLCAALLPLRCPQPISDIHCTRLLASKPTLTLRLPPAARQAVPSTHAQKPHRSAASPQFRASLRQKAKFEALEAAPCRCLGVLAKKPVCKPSTSQAPVPKHIKHDPCHQRAAPTTSSAELNIPRRMGLTIRLRCGRRAVLCGLSGARLLG